MASRVPYLSSRTKRVIVHMCAWMHARTRVCIIRMDARTRTGPQVPVVLAAIGEGPQRVTQHAIDPHCLGVGVFVVGGADEEARADASRELLEQRARELRARVRACFRVCPGRTRACAASCLRSWLVVRIYMYIILIYT